MSLVTACLPSWTVGRSESAATRAASAAGVRAASPVATVAACCRKSRRLEPVSVEGWCVAMAGLRVFEGQARLHDTRARERRKSLISIIIPTYNEAHGIRTMLDAVARLRGEPEVVVVDGGSEDETPKLALEGGARLVTT